MSSLQTVLNCVVFLFIFAVTYTSDRLDQWNQRYTLNKNDEEDSVFWRQLCWIIAREAFNLLYKPNNERRLPTTLSNYKTSAQFISIYQENRWRRTKTSFFWSTCIWMNCGNRSDSVISRRCFCHIKTSTLRYQRCFEYTECEYKYEYEYRHWKLKRYVCSANHFYAEFWKITPRYMRHQLANTVKVVTKLVCEKFKSCHTPSPSGKSKKILKRGAEDNLSAPSSFIANAHNDL